MEKNGTRPSSPPGTSGTACASVRVAGSNAGIIVYIEAVAGWVSAKDGRAWLRCVGG